jgi:hypothetical protein
LREPGARDDPASAAEAEVGGSYASLPLGVVDERGGVGDGPPSPRAKHPPNPRTLPNGPRPHPYAPERVEGEFSELLPEEVPGSSPRTPEASPYGGCAAPAAPLSCHRACASGPMGLSPRSRTAVVTGRRKGCSGKDVAQGAAGYRCAGAADGGAGADDLAFPLGRPRFSAGARPGRRPPGGRERRRVRHRAPDARPLPSEEAFAVRRGLLGYQRRGGRRGSRDPARRSCSGWASRKVLERRGEDLLCAGSIEPAHNADYFLAALFESQRENGGIGRICSTRLFFYTKEL